MALTNDDLTGPQRELLAELDMVTADQMANHRELAELLVAEKTAKVTGFDSSPANSIKERDNHASLAALNLTGDIFRLRARIDANSARIDYIQTAIRIRG